MIRVAHVISGTGIAGVDIAVSFRHVRGFGERVIFREMFLKGLTLLDLRDVGGGVRVTMSHLAARQEVRDLLHTVGLSAVAARRHMALPALGNQASESQIIVGSVAHARGA